MIVAATARDLWTRDYYRRMGLDRDERHRLPFLRIRFNMQNAEIANVRFGAVKFGIDKCGEAHN